MIFCNAFMKNICRIIGINKSKLKWTLMCRKIKNNSLKCKTCFMGLNISLFDPVCDGCRMMSSNEINFEHWQRFELNPNRVCHKRNIILYRTWSLTNINFKTNLSWKSRDMKSNRNVHHKWSIHSSRRSSSKHRYQV